MYHFLQKFHSGWAYLAFVALIIAVISSVIGMLSKKQFTATDRKIYLITLIVVHIQLLVGLILYFVSPLGFNSLGEMSNKALRLTSLEHPIINIVAITLITIGWSRHKKATTNHAKYLAINLFYALGLLLITAKIPWQLWIH